MSAPVCTMNLPPLEPLNINKGDCYIYMIPRFTMLAGVHVMAALHSHGALLYSPESTLMLILKIISACRSPFVTRLRLSACSS